jgi:hypothetical protein
MFGFSVGYGTNFTILFRLETHKNMGTPHSRYPKHDTSGQERRITGTLAGKQAYVHNYRLSLAFLPLVRQSRRFSEIMRS